MAPTLFNGAPFQVYRPQAHHAGTSLSASRRKRLASAAFSANPSILSPKRAQLSFYDKLQIIDFYHEHKSEMTQQEAIQHLRTMGYPTLSQSTLSTYLRDEELLRAYVAAHPAHVHYKRTPQVRLPEVEAALMEWVLQKQANNVRLSGAIICEKARDFCRLLGVPEAEQLSFSNGWLGRLKARFGLRAYVFHGEASSAPTDQLAVEVPRLVQIIRQFDPRDVFNADETGLFFRLPPDRGLATHQIPGVKADRTRLTYLLCANMDGSEKRQPLIIGRARRPRCFGSSQAADLGYYYFWNSTAWMVQSIWHKFLSDFNEEMMAQGRHVLLLIDNAPSHRHDASLYPHVRVEPLAPNLTSWIQPMDAGIIRCFKAHYRNGFVRLAIQRDADGAKNIYGINQLEAMQIASAAWDAVEPSTIANCWRHTGLDTAEVTPNAPVEDSPQALNHEQSHPMLQQMLEVLAASPPTEEEESEADIAARVGRMGL